MGAGAGLGLGLGVGEVGVGVEGVGEEGVGLSGAGAGVTAEQLELAMHAGLNVLSAFRLLDRTGLVAALLEEQSDGVELNCMSN